VPLALKLKISPRTGWLTFSVRRVFLDFPAQLGHVFPTSRASRLIQLLQVALGFLALRGVLYCCKLPMPNMTLLRALGMPQHNSDLPPCC
jgi:hypothetical protein